MNLASPLQLGDEVEIVGQNVHNNSMRLGQRFVIEQIIIDKKYGTMYSAPGQLGFPASSLRKVEELRIGDYVKVSSGEDVGKLFQISHIIEPYSGCHYYSDSPKYAWAASSLRKLTPDEIPQADRRYDRLERDVGNSISKVHARLSATEERHDKIVDCLRGLATLTHGLAQIAELHEGRFGDIEQRLAFVEAFQKGHVEETPCIDDVVSKILDEPALQKGDYVEVQRDGCGKQKGFVFCITYIETVESSICGPRTYYSANKLPMWTADECGSSRMRR